MAERVLVLEHSPVIGASHQLRVLPRVQSVLHSQFQRVSPNTWSVIPMAIAITNPTPRQRKKSAVVLADVDARFTQDLQAYAAKLSVEEIRDLVDTYYQLQELRKALDNRLRAVQQGADTNPVLTFFSERLTRLEGQINKALGIAAGAHTAGAWMQQFVGIGSVLSAGFLAHLDVTQAPTASHFISFAGLNPAAKWISRKEAGELVAEFCAEGVTDESLEKLAAHINRPLERVKHGAKKKERDGTVTGGYERDSLQKYLAKRPWNAKLKTHLWRLGDVLVKFQNHPQAPLWCLVYQQRKALETQRSESGQHAEVAAELLRTKKWGKTTEAFKAYTAGRLPQGQIHNRATRYAVKLFLAHLHTVMYESHFGKPAPKPYIIAHDERHTRYVPPPAWPLQQNTSP